VKQFAGYSAKSPLHYQASSGWLCGDGTDHLLEILFFSCSVAKKLDRYRCYLVLFLGSFERALIEAHPLKRRIGS